MRETVASPEPYIDPNPLAGACRSKGAAPRSIPRAASGSGAGSSPGMKLWSAVTADRNRSET